ncbi:MAG: NUDIX domain-containing protein [Pseudomonadota bacterium]
MAIDPLRLRKTLAFLLRHRPDVGHLQADAEGWFEMKAVARSVGRLAHLQLSVEELERCARSDPRGGFQVNEGRIRATPAAQPKRRGRLNVPDILYMPTTQAQLEEARECEVLPLNGRRAHKLFSAEQEAWFTAHRRPGGEPTVLHVEAARAARAGVPFGRQAAGLFQVQELPTRFILDLRKGFGIQASAGGFLVRYARNGLQVGLVRVRRRSGVTWEVAKGKVEVGESPAQTAVRELQEEMGIDTPLEVVASLGVSHYGFSTPAGEPRLKVLHLFILEPRGDLGEFDPARPEGIEQVAFFDADAAVRVVSHGSLRGPVRMLRQWIQARERGPARSRDERPVPGVQLDDAGPRPQGRTHGEE